MVLGEALDLGQHLADVFGLGLAGRPLVVQLVVRVDDQAPYPISKNSGSGQPEHPFNGGQLVVFAPADLRALGSMAQPKRVTRNPLT
jgi:hypothetical protein